MDGKKDLIDKNRKMMDIFCFIKYFKFLVSYPSGNS